jgi:hypothetical protein
LINFEKIFFFENTYWTIHIIHSYNT